MEGKELQVDMGNTKFLISSPVLGVSWKSSNDPCAVCVSGVGTNCLFCYGCSCGVYKTCIGISGTVKPDPTFRCKWCVGLTRSADGRPMRSLRWCHPSAALGTAYPQMVVFNMHSWKYILSRGTNSKSDCPPTHPAHSPSNPEVKSLWLAAAAQWAGYDPLDVQCHHQEPGQLARSPGEDTAPLSGEGTHRWPRWHGHVEHSNAWLKKVQKLPEDFLAITESHKMILNQHVLFTQAGVSSLWLIRPSPL